METEEDTALDQSDIATLREMLSTSGYAEEAIRYYLTKPNLGPLQGANHVTELSGPCGDTMKCFLKVDKGRIEDAKYQVLGCPGAVSAAMALVDLVRGKTLSEALEVRDRDVFRKLVQIPDQKQHCIRLAVKTLEKAIKEYREAEADKSGKSNDGAFDFLCLECGKVSQQLAASAAEQPECRICGSRNLKKLIAEASSLSGATPAKTGCCGSSQGRVAGCNSPGTCCGKSPF